MATQKLETGVRREQIVQAALNIVATQGLRKLSVAGIARRIGLVPSAIYRHFQSKDDVLDAAIDQFGEQFLVNTCSLGEETPDPLECLRSLLRRHVQMVRENQLLAMPRFLFADDVHSGPPERKAKVLMIIRRYLARVGEMVQQGQGAGRIRADIDAGTIALMLLGITQQTGFLWLMSDGMFDVTKHAERAWKIFSEAIKAK